MWLSGGQTGRIGGGEKYREQKNQNGLGCRCRDNCPCFGNRPDSLLFIVLLKVLKPKAFARIFVYRESRKPGKVRTKRTKFVRLIRADG